MIAPDKAAGKPQIWLDGRLVPADEGRIDPRDRGFLLGDGVFETMAARDGEPLRVAAHLARLSRGAAVLGIPVPLPAEQIAAAIGTVLATNRLGHGRAVVRVTLTRGPGGRGVVPPPAPQPTLLIASTPAPPPADRPARVTLSNVARNRHSPTAGIKCLAYADSIVARMRADALGCDEAVLTNDAGRLACATAGNLFIVRGGTLVTPAETEGILPGITRATVIALAHALGIPVEQRPVEWSELATADAMFLTNSLIGIRPVVKAIREEAPHHEVFRSRDSAIVDQLASALASSEDSLA
ncbi:MAG: aminotransferase class IV [Acetobacterales bacterium]